MSRSNGPRPSGKAFSFRLTNEERAQLEQGAGKLALGSFVKLAALGRTMSNREQQLAVQIVELWRERAELREQLRVAQRELNLRYATSHESFAAGLFAGRAIAMLELLTESRKQVRS